MNKLSINTIYKPIKQNLDDIKNCIKINLKNTDSKILQEIVSHSISKPGKMIRSVCTLLSYNTGTDSNKEKIIQLAAVLETIHLASLIHDDIIDKSEIRRNIASVYSKFGSNNAIVSGTYIYAVSVNLLSQIGNIEILDKVSKAVKKLCEGELDQIRSYKTSSIEHYLKSIYGKTVVLFETACETGALLSNSDIVSLKTYGRALGYIFQITDDYLDLFGSEVDLSKNIGQDLENGVITLPYIILHKKLSKENQKKLELIKTLPELYGMFEKELKETKEDVKQIIQKFLNEGLDSIDKLKSNNKEPLKNLLTLVNQRIY